MTKTKTKIYPIYYIRDAHTPWRRTNKRNYNSYQRYLKNRYDAATATQKAAITRHDFVKKYTKIKEGRDYENDN